MTTQYLQKSAHSSVVDECNSWLERVLIRLTEHIAEVRKGRVRKAQISQLGKLSERQLSDIGLDDPQVQLRQFGTRIESGSEYLESLRNRFLIRR